MLKRVMIHSTYLNHNFRSSNRWQHRENDSCSPTDDKIEHSNTSKYTIEQILDKASDFIDMYNYEMAQKFCQRALEIDNDNVRALETTATLLLEVSII